MKRRADGHWLRAAMCASAMLAVSVGALAEPKAEPRADASAENTAQRRLSAAEGWSVARGAMSETGFRALGPTTAALRIRMRPGWKTYWRLPGGGGLPPRFDWSGSENLARARAHWPTPIAFKSFGRRSLGYSDALDLAISAEPADPSRPITLRLRVDFAVCREICVPETVRFEQSLPERPAAPSAAKPRATPAQTPIPAADAGLDLRCALSPNGDFSLRVSPADALRDPFIVLERRISATAGRELAHRRWRRETAAEAQVFRTRLVEKSDGVRVHVFGHDPAGRWRSVAPLSCGDDAGQTARE